MTVFLLKYCGIFIFSVNLLELYKFALPTFHVPKLLLPFSHGMAVNECNGLAGNMPLTHTVVFTFFSIVLILYLHFQIAHHAKQMF